MKLLSARVRGPGVEAGARTQRQCGMGAGRHGYREEEDVGFTENPLSLSSFSDFSALT